MIRGKSIYASGCRMCHHICIQDQPDGCCWPKPCPCPPCPGASTHPFPPADTETMTARPAHRIGSRLTSKIGSRISCMFQPICPSTRVPGVMNSLTGGCSCAWLQSGTKQLDGTLRRRLDSLGAARSKPRMVASYRQAPRAGKCRRARLSQACCWVTCRSPVVLPPSPAAEQAGWRPSLFLPRPPALPLGGSAGTTWQEPQASAARPGAGAPQEEAAAQDLSTLTKPMMRRPRCASR